MDIGSILDQIRRREESASKSALLTHLLQGRDAQIIKKAMPENWKEALADATGKKKSVIYERLSTFAEFGPLIVEMQSNDPENGGMILHKEYETIPAGSLKLLLRVAKGADDAAKEAWLNEAASLSFSDLKKRVDEVTGKTVCDCVRFIEQKIEVCESCGKKRKKETDGDIG